MNKKLSIIIPVYNGAQFIKAALDSLFVQATPLLEVIVVDDGSKDDTVACIQKYFSEQIAANHLRVFSQTNQGVSAARNLGIENASGDYIGFMDSDDLALPNYIATVLAAIAQNTDMIEFGFKTFIHGIAETQKNPAEYSNPKFGQHIIAKVKIKVYSISKWYPWTRVSKKDLFSTVRFPIGVRFCEDIMTIPHLYEKARTILVLPDVLYAYRTNPNSATYQVLPDYVAQIVRYYQTIPYSGLIKDDLLRISFAFAIVSCHIKTINDWELPEHIQHDMNQLRWVLPMYWHLRPRVIAMLFYPKIFKFLRKWQSK